MASSPSDLAQVVDELGAAGRASIVETRSTVTVSSLDANAAARVCEAIQDLGWPFEIVDAANEIADDLRAEFAPFIATITKPEDPGVLRVISLYGFRQLLRSDDHHEIWQVASATKGFSSELTSFQPWGHAEIFSPSPQTKSPLKLVREAAEQRNVPADIRRWLPRSEITSELWTDGVFQSFACLAAPALIYSLASEILPKEAVIFSGPPKLRLSLPSEQTADQLGVAGFNSLRSVVGWVYENSQAAEQRHGLFCAEFARSSAPEGDVGCVFARSASDALDSARLAYQMSLSDIGKEAIKAQGDLRKAIADDTAKMIENSRSVAAAIAVSIATGIGLVAAKASSATPGWVLGGISAVVGIYLISIVVSGWMFLSLQRDIRKQWRQRLYRFISEQDYVAMVDRPAGRVEKIYHIAGVIGIMTALGAFLLALKLSGA
jgi:hypothetical protein